MDLLSALILTASGSGGAAPMEVPLQNQYPFSDRITSAVSMQAVQSGLQAGRPVWLTTRVGTTQLRLLAAQNTGEAIFGLGYFEMNGQMVLLVVQLAAQSEGMAGRLQLFNLTDLAMPVDAGD